MAEAKRILSGEQRPVRADELLADERGQLGREPRLLGRERLDDAVVEHLAFDRAALEDGALRRVELVEARCEQRLQRRRHLDLAVAGRLHHRRHLLHEERVAARGFAGSARARPRRALVPPIRASISASASSGASGCSRSTPPQPLRRSSSSGRAMQRSRIGAPVDRNATCSRRSRKTSSPHWMSSKTATTGPSAATASSSLRNAHAISSVEDVPPCPRSAASASAATGSSSSRDALRLELLQHLDDGPVGDPLPVREAASADDRRVGGGQELRHEARLAHPCRSDDRDQLAARPAARPLPRLGERSQLPLAPDQERVEAPLRGRGRHGNEPPRRHGLSLALQRQRLDGLRLDRVSSQAQRRLGEQDLTGLRRLLQPRGDVHGVTRREPLLGARDHLAAADADPPLDAELGQGQLHLRRRLQRAHGIVLVHGRQPEDRHHGVADELLDDAAVALDDRLHPLEVAREQRAERLRVERLAERRRADDVAEEHGHDLPLLAPPPVHSRAALGTEPEGAGGLVPADGAGGHAGSLGTRSQSNKGSSFKPF